MAIWECGCVFMGRNGVVIPQKLLEGLMSVASGGVLERDATIFFNLGILSKGSHMSKVLA